MHVFHLHMTTRIDHHLVSMIRIDTVAAEPYLLLFGIDLLVYSNIVPVLQAIEFGY